MTHYKYLPPSHHISPRTTHSRPNNNDRNTKGGRGRPPARDGKRTYDRRSGTGRGKEIKKGGGGARNWGSDKNDARRAQGGAAAEVAATNGAGAGGVPDLIKEEGGAAMDADGTPVSAPNDAENVAPEEKEAVVVEEETDNTMTLDEFLKAKKNGGRPESELFQPKEEKVLETDEFAGKVAKVSVEEDFLVMGGGKSLRKRGGNKGGDKKKLDVDFRFMRKSNGAAGAGEGGGRRGGDRRGGGGGDRRGRRGGRGGGGDKATGTAAGVNPLDLTAFPSL